MQARVYVCIWGDVGWIRCKGNGYMRSRYEGCVGGGVGKQGVEGLGREDAWFMRSRIRWSG